MMKIFISDAVVSRGYDARRRSAFSTARTAASSRFPGWHSQIRQPGGEQPPLGQPEGQAFGDLCERIKKMSLKEGSFISLCGDYERSAGRTRIPARPICAGHCA